MTPEEYIEKLLEVCDAKYKAYEKAGCETYFNKRIICGRCMNMKQDSLSFLRVQRQEMIYGGCNCGNCHITISSNGDIMACRRVTDSKVANILKTDWQTSDLSDGKIQKITINLKNAANVNLRHGAVDVRQLPMELAVILRG